MRHNKGFTLIELMIVVAIISILAAIIIPMVHGINEENKAVQIAAPGIGSITEPVTAEDVPDQPVEAESTETPETAEAPPAIPEMDAATPEPMKVVGVILHKAKISYGENNNPIDEYWFYVRKFDNNESGLIFDENPPTWMKIDQKIFQAKEAGQTYDSTWQPETATPVESN